MKMSSIFWGVFLVLIGLILGLNALEITNINLFFDGWWTLFIIIPCFIDLFKDKDKTGNIIGIIIGVSLLLSCQNIIDFSMLWNLLVPIILVCIGLSIIFKGTVNNKIKKEMKKLKKVNGKEYCAMFGSQNLDFAKEKFENCSLNAIFGSLKCDLSNAKIDEDKEFNISAIFGAVTVLVPENVNVKIITTPIFGGVSDERKTKTSDAKATIYVQATCMFGGVNIK